MLGVTQKCNIKQPHDPQNTALHLKQAIRLIKIMTLYINKKFIQSLVIHSQ